MSKFGASNRQRSGVTWIITDRCRTVVQERSVLVAVLFCKDLAGICHLTKMGYRNNITGFDVTPVTKLRVSLVHDVRPPTYLIHD